ncbi:MAG: hypothetical protein AAGC74_11840 [Verrucomicrobiota bacterium]
MKGLLNGALAIVGGYVAGAVVNLILVVSGHQVVPLPEGMDVSSEEGMKETAHLLRGEHFIFPLVAHALGSLVGGFLAWRIAEKSRMVYALAVGVLFLIGGISMVMAFPSPGWFKVVDLGLAYLPMAALGGVIASRVFGSLSRGESLS